MFHTRFANEKKNSESMFNLQNVSVENRGVIFAIVIMLQWSKNRSIDYARLPLLLWAKNGNEDRKK